jgi:hypothetical protein
MCRSQVSIVSFTLFLYGSGIHRIIGITDVFTKKKAQHEWQWQSPYVIQTPFTEQSVEDEREAKPTPKSTKLPS